MMYWNDLEKWKEKVWGWVVSQYAALLLLWREVEGKMGLGKSKFTKQSWESWIRKNWHSQSKILC